MDTALFLQVFAGTVSTYKGADRPARCSPCRCISQLMILPLQRFKIY
jgi:hypothetical protein